MINETQRKPSVEKDPLGEQRKLARSIRKSLDTLDSDLTVTVLGTLHAGNIGRGIKSEIDSADSISVELPSKTVTSFMEGKKSKVNKNPFWKQVLSYCKETGKPVIGVNSNAPAVRTMRIFDNRVKGGFKPNDVTPDVIVSTRSEDLARKFPEVVMDAIPQPLRLYVPALREDGMLVGDYVIAGKKRYPFMDVSEYEGDPFYYIQYRSLDKTFFERFHKRKSPPLAVVSGDLALPVEYQMTQAEADFKEAGNEFIAAHDLSAKFLDHLIRLRVDKTQVDGMLKPVNTILKQAIPAGVHNARVRHLHMGGEAHNPNLTAILTNLFEGDKRVAVNNISDERMPQPYQDGINFFSSYVGLMDGLRATEVHNDHVLIHIPNAQKAATVSVEIAGKQAFEELGRRRQMVGEYLRHSKKADTSVRFGSYVIYSLLEIAPTGFQAEGIPMGWDFPEKLAQAVCSQYPEKSKDVEKVMEMYRKRKEFYPRRRMNEFLAGVGLTRLGQG